VGDFAFRARSGKGKSATVVIVRARISTTKGTKRTKFGLGALRGLGGETGSSSNPFTAKSAKLAKPGWARASCAS
jgi:hypothetical protein